MEIRQETDYVTHYIQKVAAMRTFAERLRDLGHPVVYLKLNDPQNRQTIADNITALLHKIKCTQFDYLLPNEHRLDLQLRDLAKKLPLPGQASATIHSAFHCRQKTHYDQNS